MNWIYLKKQVRQYTILFLFVCVSYPTLPVSSLPEKSETSKSLSLKELFVLIEEQSHFSFLIRNNHIDLNESIDIDLTDKSIREILSEALKKQAINYIINNDRIIVFKTIHCNKDHSSADLANPAANESGQSF